MIVATICRGLLQGAGLQWQSRQPEGLTQATASADWAGLVDRTDPPFPPPPPTGRGRAPRVHTAPYLVPAHQEEVHGSPVDAVSLAEPGQDLFDGQPRLDDYHAGRPVRELDAAVLGGLVSLGH